jgi:GT2 family glycosyltransferase
MNMKKELSVILVTYNSNKLIHDSLDSIYKYNDLGDQLEVIVVDNCSADQEIVFSKIGESYPEVVLLKNTANNGYGNGNNVGVLASKAKHFVVMNPDVRLVKPIFKKILAKFEAKPQLGMLGVTFVDGSNHLYYKPEHVTLFRLVFGKVLICIGLYKEDEMFFSGSFLAFDRQKFIEAEMFDNKIFLYHEEADISNRLLAKHYLVELATDLSVMHLAHGREVNKYLLKVGSESRHYYFEKYNGNLKRFYSNYLLVYRFKYLIASILRNEIKKNEFAAWISMCKSNGAVD